MASGRSLDLARLRRRPVLLTATASGPHSTAGPTHTHSRDELRHALARVRKNDRRRTAAAARAWAR